MSSRSWLMWMVAAMAVSLAAQLYLWPHITDDAYITFRYALNLSSGHGFAFNPGEFVEGFSNPLWTLLLAFSRFITGADIPDIARILGLGCSLGIIVLIARMTPAAGDRAGFLPLGLAMLFLVLNPAFHVYATAGLEGPLLGFLLTAGTLLSLQPTQRSHLFAALFMGLAGISRPEGPLYAALWFLATLTPPFHLSTLVRNEGKRFLIMTAPILAWQAFRVSYFGAWLPNTAIAKVPGVFAEFINFPEYITPWIISAGGPILLLLWLTVRTRGEYVRTTERIALAIGGANVIFVAYAQGDWMVFGRFIAPIWPVVSVALAFWMSSGIGMLRESMTGPAARFLPSGTALGVILSSLIAWYPSMNLYLNNTGMTMLMRGTDQLAVGTWIDKNISSDATIATGRLGGISYGAMENIVWDWFGLTDAEEAAHIRSGRPGTLLDDPVFRRRPDVIAAIDAPADWSYKRTTQLMDFLKENYIFVMVFPQGRYGYVDIWIRKDRIDTVLLTREEFVLENDEKKE